jgi:hypothetical protein
MKVHQEVHLKSKILTGEQVIEVLRKFTLEMSSWSFIDEQSAKYTQDIGFPSCVIQLDDGYAHPAFAITCHKDTIYYIANIFPLRTGQILMKEYNCFSMRFVKDFRSFVRNKKISLSVSISKENIGLEVIIPSPKVRSLFERYLNLWPTSYHPNDIERLDVFICAASRYCRRKIDLDWLRRYLIEDLSWTSSDADWCFNRIESGLDILKVNRNFY